MSWRSITCSLSRAGLNGVMMLSPAGSVIATTTTTADLMRLRAKADCEKALRNYPRSQVVGVTASLVLLCALGCGISREITSVSRLYTITPLFLLTGVVLFATVSATRSARRGMNAVIAQL